MDEEKLKKAADLLKGASDVLLSVRNNSNSNTTSPTIAPDLATSEIHDADKYKQWIVS